METWILLMFHLNLLILTNQKSNQMITEFIYAFILERIIFIIPVNFKVSANEDR